MIKTPIEWNELAEDFLDADDCLITAEDVANALNTAADQSRVIEVMQKALEHYASDSNWQPIVKGRITTDIYAGEGCGFDVAANALAEAKRIMEGK